MTRTKCAHPGCRCDVEAAFGRFCSEFCYDSMRTAAEEHQERCRCGHPDCNA